MKQLATAFGLAALVIASCGNPDSNNTPEVKTPDTEQVEPGVKHNVDPHPDLKANEDSLTYTYPRVAKNGFYMMNRSANTPVNILPIEAYEKLFSTLGSCGEGQNNYMAIDRRKPALIEDISVSENGDKLTLDLPTPSESTSAFLNRFKDESIVFLINEKVIYQGTPADVNGGEKIELNCSNIEKAEIEKMIETPLEERPVN